MKQPGRNNTTYLRNCVLLFALGLMQSAVLKAENLYLDYSAERALDFVVEQFLHNLAEDVRLNHIFFETAQSSLREQLLLDICAGFKGPCHALAPVTIPAIKLNAGDLALVQQHLHQAMTHSPLAPSLQQHLLLNLSRPLDNQMADLPLASL